MQLFYASRLSYTSPPLWKTYKPVSLTNLCKLSLFPDIGFGCCWKNEKTQKPWLKSNKPLTKCQKCDILKKSMSAKKCVFYLRNYDYFIIGWNTYVKGCPFILVFLQMILFGVANCCFYIFTLYIKIYFCPHTFYQKYRMNFKKI